LVRVVNLQNRRELVVRVNDRGPFVDDRLIDLSQEAARQLGFEGQGLAPVRVQFVSLADAEGVRPQPTTRQVRGAALVSPAEPQTQLAASTAPRCHGPFIQVGAFAEPARAHRVMAKLNALQPMPVTLATLAQDQLARVRLGPIPDPTTAYATLDRLQRSGFSEAFIIPLEKEPAPSC
jgi:rare lipoprotein A